MKKITYLGLVVALAALIVPAFSLAQSGEVNITPQGNVGEFQGLLKPAGMSIRQSGSHTLSVQSAVPGSNQQIGVTYSVTASNDGILSLLKKYEGQRVIIYGKSQYTQIEGGFWTLVAEKVSLFGDANTTTGSECSSDSDCKELVCPNGGFVHEQCSSGQCVLSSKCPDQTQCSSDSDCKELVCPNGGFVHERCNSGQCVLSSKCPNQDENSFISIPVNGQCPDNNLTSQDGKECIKLDSKTPIAPKEGTKEPVVGSGGDYKIVPINNTCPDNYILSNDGKECLKPLTKPQIIIAPKEGFKEVTFGTDGNVTIKDNNANKETKIAPKEGFKTVVSVESNAINQPPTVKEVSVQSDANSSQTTISTGNVSASTNESISVKENKVFLKEAEVKIMPDTASQNAITKLGDLGFKIELKDVGQEQDVKPSYEAVGTQDVKIFGLFKIKMTVSANVDAQTGVVSELSKPWWSFLVR